MTLEQASKKIKSKGWTIADACARWKMNPPNYRMYMNDPDHKMHTRMTDLVNGLPDK